MSKNAKDKVKTSYDSMAVSTKILYSPENGIDNSLRQKLIMGLAKAEEPDEEINIEITSEEFKRLLAICESV
ncbi:MAG: hypothetical protein WBE18_01660 [Gammaproteobacteria bacterium]